MKQEVIIERDYQAEWWSKIRGEAFSLRIRMMDVEALQRTAKEMADAITILSNARQRRGRSDPDWWARGTSALGYMQEKRAMIRQEIDRRPHPARTNGGAITLPSPRKADAHQARMVRIGEIRDLAATNPGAALQALCDVLTRTP